MAGAMIRPYATPSAVHLLCIHASISDLDLMQGEPGMQLFAARFCTNTSQKGGVEKIASYMYQAKG